MLFTLSLLLIIIANIGTLLVLISLARRQTLIVEPGVDPTPLLETQEKANRRRYEKLAAAMAQAFDATGTLIADIAEGSAKDRHALRVAIASVRHDSSLDATQNEKRFDELKELIAGEGKLTRQRIAQVKVRLADEEKDDQRAKAKARTRKH